MLLPLGKLISVLFSLITIFAFPMPQQRTLLLNQRR
jgi:hypothetical protein